VSAATHVQCVCDDMSSDGTLHIKLLNPTDLHIKDKSSLFYFLMGLVDFKHDAPNYEESPVYPDNMKSQAFWIKISYL